MPIVWHYSLELSFKVLKLVRKHLRGSKVRFTIMVWANGREQGLSIDRLDDPSVMVNFAQQRNSDSVVVISGEPEDFDLTTHQPSEKAWSRARYFHRRTEAAKHISDELLFWPMRNLTREVGRASASKVR